MTDRGHSGKCQPVGTSLQRPAAPGPARALHAVPSADAPLSLATIYRAHVDFVVKVTRQLGIPEAQAEDVVHDVFLVVHRRLADYETRTPMRSWLYGITRRVAMHHQRRHTRSRAREAHAPTPVASASPEESVQTRETRLAVEHSLATLDDEQRLVFVLMEIEGVSAPQVAADHGLKLNTVYSRLRLARKKFEPALAQALRDRPARGQP